MAWVEIVFRKNILTLSQSIDQLPKFVNIPIINNWRMHFKRGENASVFAPFLHLRLSHVHTFTSMIEVSDAVYVETRFMFLTPIGVPHNIPVFLGVSRSEEHTSELQSRPHLVCRLLLEKK